MVIPVTWKFWTRKRRPHEYPRNGSQENRDTSIPGQWRCGARHLLCGVAVVCRAEQDLIAANAQIGVAKSLYYPAISLTAAFGFSSTDLSKLFRSEAQAWSFAAPVIAPIFTAGAIKGQVKLAEAQRQELIVRYQQVIQTAFREVDDFLVEQKQTKPQLEALGRRTGALREYARLAQMRFDNGYTSYLEVLDAKEETP